MRVSSCTYLLPIRRARFSSDEAAELGNYFRILGVAGCEVLVVDGSPTDVFAEYDRAWSGLCRHKQVDSRFTYLNDKVNGIHTGVELAQQEKIVLADDDIRYDVEALSQILAQLDEFEVVRPQNFLEPLPWWARIEAARMLINRGTLAAADYPGTCAFRRTAMQSAGPYDGDVLFDNEEIIRHFALRGASVDYAVDLFVRKRAPAFRKWIEQRPRQAYEDFPLRAKTALFFALPQLAIFTVALFGRTGTALFFAVLCFTSMFLALKGRTRGQAAHYFPRSIIFWAPLWTVERSLSSYWALYWRIVRGGYPFGARLLSKGIGRDWRRGGRIAARQIRGIKARRTA